MEFLVAGLGNPGKKYFRNRHNAGWLVLSALAKRYNTELKNHWGKYFYFERKLFGKNVLFIQPAMYMNCSGEVIEPLMRKYKLPAENLLIICDEYNFPTGKIHLKLGGSSGGHNGVESIIDYLDSSNFYRLRCGIGKNFSDGGMVDYVLEDFPENETEIRDKMFQKACDAIEYCFKAGFKRAMSDVNSEVLFNPPS